MSLTNFTELSDVAIRLDAIAPKVALPAGIQLAAPPLTTNYPIVGTAFDYLLRFELHRRMPHAEDRPWTANGAPSLAMACIGLVGDPIELMDEMRAALDTAKRDHKTYLRAQPPTAAQRSTMAEHAIRLAQMDQVNRGMRIEPYLAGVDKGDIRDLLQLLDVVPAALFAPAKRVLLNPTFGEATDRLVGGADCDLIMNGALIDIKTTIRSAPERKWIRQLVGYFILARHARAADRAFPEITRIGIYFARHGNLWSMSANELLKQSMFLKTEQWFIARAKKETSEPGELAAPGPKRMARKAKLPYRRAAKRKPASKKRTTRKKARRR